MQARMPPLPTKATIEEKTDTCTDWRRTTEDNNNLKKSLIHESTQTAKTETVQENPEWAGVTGWLTSATIATNFELETVVTRCPINFEISDVTRFALM